MNPFAALGEEGEEGDGEEAEGVAAQDGGEQEHVVSSGRRKKLIKKVKGGKVFETRDYLEYMAMRHNEGAAVACPIVAVSIDPTRRAQARFDLTSVEVRHLLLYLLENKFNCAAPKQFVMRNHPFVRNIVLLHANNAPQTLPHLAFTKTPVALLRTSSSYTHVGTLPYRLLSAPPEELTAAQRQQLADWAKQAAASSPASSSSSISSLSSSHGGLLQCVLTDGQRTMWGYPVAAPLLDEEAPEPKAPEAKRPRPSDDAASASVLPEETGEAGEAEERKEGLIPSHAFACAVIARHGLCRQRVDMKGTLLTGFSSTQPRGWLDPAAFLSTTSTSSSSAPLALLAVDCEMCMCAEGHQLSRVSVVDPRGAVLMDNVVRPRLPITDYLSQYSGISAESYSQQAEASGRVISFEQAHVALLRLVSADTVLVGHSLQSDLKALRLLHGTCLDTAIAFPHPRGFPYRMKLKELCSFYLKREIQQQQPPQTHHLHHRQQQQQQQQMRQDSRKRVRSEAEEGEEEEEDGAAVAAVAAGGGQQFIPPPPPYPPRDPTLGGLCTGGHDPVEDALAAMQLAQLKILHGPEYGGLSHMPEQKVQVPVTRFLDPNMVKAVRYYDIAETVKFRPPEGGEGGADQRGCTARSTSHATPTLAVDAVCSDLQARGDEQNTSLGFFVLTLDHGLPLDSSGLDAAGFAAAHARLRAALATLPHCSLLLTTAQLPTQAASALLQQRRACEAAKAPGAGHRNIASVWDQALEGRLRAEVSKANMAAFCCETVLPARQDK